MSGCRLAGAVLLLLAAAAGGCNLLGPLAYYLGPPRVQQAEFKLTPGRLALLIEAVHPEQDNPVFNRALYDRLVEIFREKKVKSAVVPYGRVLGLRQAHRDFASWSLQRIGRELHADQVLYLRIEELRLRPTPEHPLVWPRLTLRAKVIGVHEPSVHARLWPEQPEGRAFSCQRPPQQADNQRVIDDEALKLARQAAYLVCQPFVKVDLEERPPREP